jgi:hypothetical protein
MKQRSYESVWDAIEDMPRAQSAKFDRVHRKIVISFTNGTEFGFPPELAQVLDGATDDQLAEVRLSGGGFGLHWDSLDAGPDSSRPRESGLRHVQLHGPVDRPGDFARLQKGNGLHSV